MAGLSAAAAMGWSRLFAECCPFGAGEVKAVAYGKDGAVLGTQVLRTAGKPVKIVLEKERTYDGLCVVRVMLADKDGNVVPNDSRRIGFVAGGCEIAAVGNSNPRGLDSFKETSSHPLCYGREAVYLRGMGRGAKLKAFAKTAGTDPIKRAFVWVPCGIPRQLGEGL